MLRLHVFLLADANCAHAGACTLSIQYDFQSRKQEMTCEMHDGSALPTRLQSLHGAQNPTPLTLPSGPAGLLKVPAQP
jgi:hypothetical protein